MAQLKTETIEKIRENRPLKKALIDHFECSETTLYNYLRENSPQLTLWDSIQIIAAYLHEEPESFIELFEYLQCPVAVF